MSRGGVDDVARDRCAADKFGNDIHLRIGNDFAPVAGARDIAQTVGQFQREYRAAADCRNAQPEPQFQRDLIGICSENRKSSLPDIAEPDHPYLDIFHVKGMIPE